MARILLFTAFQNTFLPSGRPPSTPVENGFLMALSPETLEGVLSLNSVHCVVWLDFFLWHEQGICSVVENRADTLKQSLFLLFLQQTL